MNNFSKIITGTIEKIIPDIAKIRDLNPNISKFERSFSFDPKLIPIKNKMRRTATV